ncbi:MAG: ABC transporter substrate-binding protein [Ferruginibacter sp.]
MTNFNKNRGIKVCSFLPAATQMIYDMGLQHLLHGVTFECPKQALEEKQICVRYVLEGNTYSSIEIDKIFSASKAQGKSLYYVDDRVLRQIQPDIIFTQDVCEVCQIDTACTAAAVAKLDKQPTLVPLSPNNLTDVFNTAITIATAMGKEEAAYAYLAKLRSQIDFIIDELRRTKALPKRVLLMEWIAPIYNCGHWIPHQIAYAGGIDMLGNPGGDSIVTSWEKIKKYDPEVLVIAPCGFDIKRTRQEIDLLIELNGWSDLSAVKNGAVFIADYDLFTQPSAGTLVDGIALLAALFHPEIFSVPVHLRNKYAPLLNEKVYG